VLDAIDERALTLPELRDLGQFLFGYALPDPTVDWNGFLQALQACMQRERPHFNPIYKKVTPWFNLKQLNDFYTRPPKQSAPTAAAATAAAPPPRQQQPAAAARYNNTQPPPPGPGATHQPPMSSTNARAAMPATVTPPRGIALTTADLQTAIAQTWSKQPPMYTQIKGIAQLLGTLDTAFPLVETHVYFTKFHSFSQDALNGNNADVLKRAVRKTRLFLHPDKLPKDLNERQQLLCRELWDTISEAWSAHSQ
jgi:hypothetical protein